MASSTLVLPCAFSPTSKTARRGISISRRVRLRKLVRERCFRYMVAGYRFTGCRLGLTLDLQLSTCNSKNDFQFYFIAQRNVVLPDHRDARFALAGFVHCAAMDGDQFKSATLVKTKRV